MEKQKNSTGIPRSRFLYLGSIALASLGLIKWRGSDRSDATGSQKYLTQDGRLVEVENKNTKPSGIKLLVTDIKNWITRS